jgi:hypothetical protein
VSVEYTDPEGVTDVSVTSVPVSGQTVTGYGGKIPTRHMIEYLGQWRRVYVMVYGNGGTPYVRVKGRNVVLDADTQHRLTDAG